MPAMLEVPAAELALLPSASLVVDLAAVDRNIQRAASMVAGSDARMRPHFKAHRSSRLMLRQLAAGGCVGATAQTVGEAVVLVAAGVEDILVAAPVVDPQALATLARLASHAAMSVVVDCVEHVAMLDAAASLEGSRLRVLIELDVGSGRCGVPFGDERLLGVAAACADAAHLTLVGIQAYEGHASLRDDPTVRATLVHQVAAHIRFERARLTAAGYPCEVMSGAGTGTAQASIAARAHNEIQAGSYVLMDSAYAAIGVPFESSVACVTRCVSRREDSAAVLDAGLKAMTTDHGVPRPFEPGIRVLGLSDEHSRIALSPGVDLRIGQVVLLEPSHLDPTVNLHDALFVWDAANQRMERWPVDGRRTTVDAIGHTETVAPQGQTAG